MMESIYSSIQCGVGHDVPPDSHHIEKLRNAPERTRFREKENDTDPPKSLKNHGFNVLPSEKETLQKRKRQLRISRFIPSKRRKRLGISKIISGGQCGADRGALEAGRALQIQTGGWAPATFKTENGSDYLLSTQFHLQALSSSDYRVRTRKNVDDSDGTLAFRLKPSRGTDKTIGYAQSKKWTNGKLESVSLSETQYKPVCVIQSLEDEESIIKTIRSFIQDNEIDVLNVSGHRESQYQGVCDAVFRILKMALNSKEKQNT